MVTPRTMGGGAGHASLITLYFLLLVSLVWGCQDTVAPPPDAPAAKAMDAAVTPLLTSFYTPAEVITTLEGLHLCHTITFEGAPHYLPISPEENGMVLGSNTAFSPNWRTLTRGPFANNPSGVAIVVWLQDSHAEVNFEEPVSQVGFYYSSYVEVGLELYDAEGQLLATGTSPANVNGGYTVWDPFSMDVQGNRIVRAVISGVANGTALDDMKNCITLSIQEVAQQALGVIGTLAENGSFTRREIRSLEASLENAIAAAERGNGVSAINMMEAFIKKTEAMVRSGRLTAEDADALLNPIRALLDALGP